MAGLYLGGLVIVALIKVADMFSENIADLFARDSMGGITISIVFYPLLVVFGFGVIAVFLIKERRNLRDFRKNSAGHDTD